MPYYRMAENFGGEFILADWRASLIVSMEFTIESCVRGHRFSKEFCTPKERGGFSVNARKAIRMTCTRPL